MVSYLNWKVCIFFFCTCLNLFGVRSVFGFWHALYLMNSPYLFFPVGIGRERPLLPLRPGSLELTGVPADSKKQLYMYTKNKFVDYIWCLNVVF